LSLSHALRNRCVLGFLAIWFGVNILFGVGSIAIGMDGASVAWQAHIGGCRARAVFVVRPGAARACQCCRCVIVRRIGSPLIAACGAA
jgi:membrane associated rhomboid family serine protease